jgi:hypothetical protein
MFIKSLVEAVSYARDATDSLGRRQSREFLIAWRFLQRGQGDNPFDQRAFSKKAFRRFEPDQIVEQLRRLARRRREFRRLGLAEIESADGTSVLRNDRTLIEGHEALAASRTTVEQTSSISPAGHDAGAAPLLSKIWRLVFGEAHRAELLPRRMFLVRLDSAERQKQRPPFLAADRHGRDPIAVDAGLMMQEVQHGSRQGEVEPCRPGAGAEPELFPEMSRRQAVSESEPMQPARQKFVTQGCHLHRPTLGEKCRETRLDFDRGTGVSAHP